MFGRDVTTSASRPSASSMAASAACRSARLSRLEIPGKRFESQPIAVGPESGHHAHCKVREQRPAPLRLACEDVGEMHFHERYADREQRIAHRKTGMRKRRRVDQRAVGTALQALDRLHQLAFMIRLNPRAFDAQREGALLRGALDFSKARAAINLRLALSQ